MTRHFWMLAHRYMGLVMVIFLVVCGLTGSLLAFYDELDTAVNASVMTVTPPNPDSRPLDPLVLREMVQARYPDAWVHWVPLQLRHNPGHAMSFWLEGPTDPTTGQHAEIPNDELFVNPYTGEVLGKRKWGDITQGLTNLMPFVYRLHYALALGTVGEYVLGIVAFLWTLDCFIGAYLTFPATRRGRAPHSRLPSGENRNSGRRGWLGQWWQSWKIRWYGGPYKINFDLHRAGGLWPWAMLLVIAWSSVGFNLQEVYKPVMGTLFAHQPSVADLPRLDVDQPQPSIPWSQALEKAQVLMADEAANHGFTVLEPAAFSYDPHKGLYRYSVKSDRDISETWGGTSVWFDATTGERRLAYLPSGEAGGDTIGNWLFALHLAAVWGLPFKIFISVLGIVVAVLSVTGVVIWRKKSLARQIHQVRSVPVPSQSPAAVWDP